MTNTSFEQLGSLLSIKAAKAKKPPAFEWQELALKIIKELYIPNDKRSSVFKACKTYPKATIERCLNDTKELCKTGDRWKYFFKIINNLVAKDF